MGDSPNKNKMVVAGVASILLVAAVAAVAVGFTKGDRAEDNSPATTTKAVQALCSSTDYKDTCEKSLSNAQTSDAQELIQIAFNVTVENISGVLKNSKLLQEAAADPRTKGAYHVCQTVLETAVDDLKRSIDHFAAFDATKTSEYVEDLRAWLSAVVNNHETCIDAFEETEGNAGEKMKKVLEMAKEMSSNGLAMVNDASSIVSSLQFGRRLLSDEPEFATRRLLQAFRMDMKPTIVVAKDGSGQFKTVGEAIAALPKKSNDSVVIYVKEGVYEEYVDFPKRVNNVMLVGDGPLKTRITGNKAFAKGVPTFDSATVAVNGDDFFAKDIGFENSAGPAGHQAVALRVSGDKAVFFNVAIDGYQDTLYAHNYRHYYRDCSISGTIDFIFGDALAIFQNCQFIVRKPGPNQACMVTAEGRFDPRSVGAFVIQNGNITAEPALLTTVPPVKAYLGRPWKELSRTIIMQSSIDGFIDPTGWAPWEGTFAIDTCYYGEYENRGSGSNTDKRVQWKGIHKITPEIAESWTGGEAYKGDDGWIKQTGVPYDPTLMQV